MAKLKIEIELDNDAFRPEPTLEVNRLLKRYAAEIFFHGLIPDTQWLADENGNRVMTAELVK